MTLGQSAILATRPARVSDAIWFLDMLRAPDAAEIWTSSDGNALRDLEAGIKAGQAYVTYANGKPMALWGVHDVLEQDFLGPRVGMAWLVTTKVVDSNRLTFFRGCRQVLRELFNTWDVLTNFIDTRHKAALEWGSRLGFIYDKNLLLLNGVPFRRFAVTKESFNVASTTGAGSRKRDQRGDLDLGAAGAG